MNAKAKGNRMEIKAKKVIEMEGFTVERVRNVPFHHGDLFGCADLIGMKKDYIVFIAVTSRSNKSRAKKALANFVDHPPSVVKQVLTYPGEWEGFDIDYIV